ncbi:hypothetical protein, partial [Yersinia massiliensis]|uniref:hypothetical protein n=1 Tax=Yersinia massiliensis TaxID=419257 RepID=UPI0028D59211
IKSAYFTNHTKQRQGAKTSRFGEKVAALMAYRSAQSPYRLKRLNKTLAQHGFCATTGVTQHI